MTGSESYPKPQIALVPIQDNSYSTPCTGVYAPSHGYTPSCPPLYVPDVMYPVVPYTPVGGICPAPSPTVSPAFVAAQQSEKLVSQKCITQTQVESRSFEELEAGVVRWGAVKGLLGGEDPTKQVLKAISEFGEFADQVLKGNLKEAEMELGDVYVTLILAGAIMGVHPDVALGKAYDKITKRTGKTVDGVFIKD